MQLFVKENEHVRSLELPEGATVAMLKKSLSLSSDMMLASGAEIFDEDDSSLDLENGSTVYILPRLLGGKVHGSLARAGKVRAQTPKVEKQDKKKRKQGRAARRIQYTRRFVNVATGPGKKRGPNSNS